MTTESIPAYSPPSYPPPPYGLDITNDQSQPKSPSPFLPHELHTIIISLLAKEKAALASSCRVSKEFNTISTPPLYARLEINLLPYSDHPIRIIPSFDPTVAKFSFTTHLTIHPHTYDLCSSIRFIPTLPNLTTLRICTAGNQRFCQVPPEDSPASAMSALHGLCSLTARLRPGRLIVDWNSQWPSYLDGLSAMTRDSRPGPLEELVVLVALGTRGQGREYISPASAFNCALPKLTFVVHAGGPAGSESRRAVLAEGLGLGLSELEVMARLAQGTCEVLARACGITTVPVTVLGLECAEFSEEELGSTTTERMDEVKVQLKARLMAGSWGESEAAERAEGIKFAERVDYEGELE